MAEISRSSKRSLSKDSDAGRTRQQAAIKKNIAKWQRKISKEIAS